MQHHPKSCPREKDPAGPEMGVDSSGVLVPVLQKGWYSFQAVHHFACEDSSPMGGSSHKGTLRCVPLKHRDSAKGPVPLAQSKDSTAFMKRSEGELYMIGTLEHPR